MADECSSSPSRSAVRSSSAVDRIATKPAVSAGATQTVATPRCTITHAVATCGRINACEPAPCRVLMACSLLLWAAHNDSHAAGARDAATDQQVSWWSTMRVVAGSTQSRDGAPRSTQTARGAGRAAGADR